MTTQIRRAGYRLTRSTFQIAFNVKRLTAVGQFGCETSGGGLIDKEVLYQIDGGQIFRWIAS